MKLNPLILNDERTFVCILIVIILVLLVRRMNCNGQRSDKTSEKVCTVLPDSTDIVIIRLKSVS